MFMLEIEHCNHELKEMQTGDIFKRKTHITYYSFDA